MARTPPPISQQQAAALIGVSDRRLRQLDHEDAPPPRVAEGYPCADLGDWMRERFMAEVGVGTDGQAISYENERARLTKAQADHEELKVAQLRQILLPADEVAKAWGGMMAEARATLLALPARLAAMAVSQPELKAIEDFGTAEVHRALDALAGRNVSAADDADSLAAGDAPSVGAAAETDGEPVGRKASVPKPRSNRKARKVAKR